MILYNMFVHKTKGFDSVPGLEKVIKLALAAKIIRDSVIFYFLKVSLNFIWIYIENRTKTYRNKSSAFQRDKGE